MSDQFSPIRPKPVPLSHEPPRNEETAGRGASSITWGLGIALALGLLVLVFFVVPAWLETAARPVPSSADGPGSAQANEVASADGSATTAIGASAQGEEATGGDQALPPYQQLQRQQAREKAQKELGRFVKLQIQLEDAMKVGAWGQDEYDAAKRLAAAGDEQFVKEQFQQSMTSYQSATRKLADLIEHGKTLLEESLKKGSAALIARDQARADKAFAMAGTIAPDDPRVAAGKARAALLPRVGALMRQGRNQELAEDWSGAATTYDQVKSLDPATSGLDAATRRVAEGRRQDRIQTLLSQGFDHLDAQRFDDARAAFQSVLKLDADNGVAKGGIEQVTRRSDVARIRALKVQADQAVTDERWGDAMTLYARVLEIDSTIQFAKSGQERARNQQRIRAALARILENPERLSSDKLYREAGDILSRAETLEPRGPKLASQIDDVRTTLDTYGSPVAVVLRSDNRTEVTLSTIGSLGSFEEKRLELRPGAYTVIGSRDGCRDVREQIVVRPNMSPVDIRCVEAL